ncbi:leucine-rich repeat receptor-like serine/threonine-protein kinase At2g14510 [Populus nigra]|uniref:leucine-rich repeat receptor-like serine/threonine-protein kinase At2g14510 n=1 Tax=Populus nigra TaxID=3691 RepID=UPI002B27B5EA|nr:leucine-rich repeat receptor-like serine/threonine-protein kinase At2g14510 [Populus nigra]XP_061985426.1 leucine-rich repeat receptor-like serine/threonine-protein kinase At2g14510 [Populus nigra]
MSPPSLIILISVFSILSLSTSQPPPLRRTLIDCGATVPSTINGLQWILDTGYITGGTAKNLTVPVLNHTLSTVRSFPLQNNLRRKFCYVVNVFRGAKYMIRSTYFYGGINGNDSPPVFDQIVDGTLWSVVNTTEDYRDGMSSYYEGVFLARGKTMSFCIAANSYTESDPFISALEFVILENSLYNSTDFKQAGLSLVARHSFGHNERIRYPDDQFDRVWEPFGANDSTISSSKNVSVSTIWNLPPTKIFETELTTGRSSPQEMNWPPVPLPNSTYYIALYFAHDHNSSPGGSRIIDISINGVPYYKNMTVTPAGVVVFANKWPLGGLTKVALTPATGLSIDPLINGGEVFDVIALGGRTLTRDVIALEALKSSFQNAPHDWNGDPCMPRQFSWTGIACSEGPRIRVVTLNLTSMGLSGSLPLSIARLTALTGIWLGNNTLSGSIPDFSSLKMLETLHLEDNQFTGEIPLSLGNIKGLRELFLQNNNLTGQIPNNLIGKPGLNLRTSGNQFLSPSPS